MNNLNMYNTISTYANRFAHLSDKATNWEDKKNYNKMFIHYYSLAREFNNSWTSYKEKWGLA